MILRVSHLKSLIQKDYIKEYFHYGFDNLVGVCLKLVKPPVSASKYQRPRSPSLSDSDASSFLSDLFEEENESEEYLKKSTQLIREQMVKKEVEKLLEILVENNYNIKVSNSEFWRKHERLLPQVYKLAIILCNIQSSSAFIERFLSICGVVCKKRATNMNNKLIIMRSVMKANIHILENLNQGYD